MNCKYFKKIKIYSALSLLLVGCSTAIDQNNMKASFNSSMKQSPKEERKENVKKFLTSLEINLKSGYDEELNAKQVDSVLNFFNEVFQERSKTEQQIAYKEEYASIKDPSEKKAIEWIFNKRLKKYNHSSPVLLVNTEEKNKLNNLDLCKTSDHLKASREVSFVDMKKYQEYCSCTEEPVMIGKRILSIDENRLTTKRGRKDSPKNTLWVVERTIDGRYVWRSECQVDKHDVKDLLYFILNKRDRKKGMCPSIAINAGSHGLTGSGKNAYEEFDFRLTDVRIYEETSDSIYTLLSENSEDISLNYENAKTKVYIHQISSHSPCVYPEMADHVIDPQCEGALAYIRGNLLLRVKTGISPQPDLFFLDNSKGYDEDLFNKLYDEKNYAEAYKLAKESVDRGNIGARGDLARIYYTNDQDVVAVDYKKVISLCVEAAEQGYANAQTRLGFCYDNGWGVDKNCKKAVEWYIKAAEQGYSKAQCCLGSCYENGTGVEKSPKKAVEWYIKAAEQGDVWAQDRLGWFYNCGIGGVEQNYKKSIEWYTKSAQQGSDYAMAALGNHYYLGEGVLKNIETAMQWYKKAADKGHVQAAFNLGKCYDEKVMYNESIQWYTKAADQGYLSAQLNLAIIYANCNGKAPNYLNYKKAVEWWRKAAEQGSSEGEYFLGVSYSLGNGVEKDQSQAVVWYKKAAKQGHDRAIDQLRELGHSNF